MTAVAVMSREIRLSDGGAQQTGTRTSWVMLFPQGKYKTERHGTLDFTKAQLAEIKAGFDAKVRGIDIAVDVDHRAPNANDTRAAGWLRRVEMGETVGREPGLWGEVEWTPYGLAEVESQQYRYISSEYQPGVWKNEITGAHAKNVLFGLTLTNRPVMKNMPAIQLAEVSTRAWGSVDKSCLPDSAFLDPKNRRLPVYEGAGPKDANGRYTQRGKLNINAVRDALAAVHGARSGKAMTGLPAGVATKLEGWLAHYTESDSASTEGTTKAAEVGRVGAMAAEQEFDEETTELADPMVDNSGDEEYADGADDGDGSDSEDNAFDADSDTHGAMDTSGHSHGKFGKHSHDGDGNHSDAPMKGGKQMSERGLTHGLTLAEQNRQLVERVRQLERTNYEQHVAKILGGWEAGTVQFAEVRGPSTKLPNDKNAKAVAGRPVKVALSRPAFKAAQALMLSEDYAELPESLRTNIARVIELAATTSVDLSMRGGTNTTEKDKTVRLAIVKPASQTVGGGDAADRSFDAAWREQTVALAEADGEDWDHLVATSKQPGAVGLAAAAKVESYQGRAYKQTLAGA